MDSPLAVALFLLVPGAVFAALNQAFVGALGHKRSWMASIAFAVLQAVSLGGRVGSAVATAFRLLVWGTAGFVVTAVAAQRRQRLSLARVRRHVATGPA